MVAPKANPKAKVAATTKVAAKAPRAPIIRLLPVLVGVAALMLSWMP